MMNGHAAIDRPRIVIYSHDTMGLGHVRRNLLLAETLAGPALGADVLLLSGVCEAARFSMPTGVDCVTLPAIAKGRDGRYQSRRLRRSFGALAGLRAGLISSAIDGFAPHLFIVDHAPSGAGGEIVPVLEHLRDRSEAQCVLGLRDIADSPETVRREWAENGLTALAREFYHQIWVYGDPRVYDRISEDGMAPDLAARTVFVGYLDQRARRADPHPSDQARIEPLLRSSKKVVACMVGGGQDGARLAEAFAATRFPADCVGAILSGPFLAESSRRRLVAAAETRDDLVVLDFLSDTGPLLARADRVICMGGYNTVGEILSFEKPALIVPRVTPRQEQRVRAERLQALGLADMLEPGALSPSALEKWLAHDVPAPRSRARVDLGALQRLPDVVGDLLELGTVKTPRWAQEAGR